MDIELTPEEIAEYESAYEEASKMELEELIDRVTDLVLEGRRKVRAAKKREALATAGYLQTFHPDPREAVKGLAVTSTAFGMSPKEIRETANDIMKRKDHDSGSSSYGPLLEAVKRGRPSYRGSSSQK